ncbi:flagellar biosynthetic protein FliR [Lutispora sp.]|uniref:flagellar biosynthetic protein FliR n=1 Tax=Lutispora sp. TaxID=2828727 RepID=UPI000EDEF704|nr:flagellar biosynthetic protein FliR [Lutispora sp.]MEA4962749.1 flagellar biosynthetic protein FliR [Lutispora sp.]HCJ58200.1 flagellar type III secretion system protein FliR [Clostridiaceae bacterium]
MNEITDLFINKFLIYLLVFVRMTSLFVISPVFGRQNMPSYLKVGLAVFSTFTIAPLFGNIVIEYTNLIDFSIIVFKEFLVGIIIGFVSYMVFAAMFVAGQMIDAQIGFGMVNVLDPQSNIQVPLVGNFLYIFAILIFLLVDGHHILFSALVKSYNVVPINGFLFTESLINNLVAVFVETFSIALKIGFPIIAAVLISEVALGILSRTVPQMNVFIVGLPMKIALGLLALLLIMPGFSNTLDYLFEHMFAYISIIIQSMTKG